MRRSWLIYAVVYLFFLTTFSFGEVRKVTVEDLQLGPANSTYTSPGGHVGHYFPYPYAGAGTSAIDNAAVVDVRAYGAVGDGTTDDTTALQAAIDAATSGVVVLPAGKNFKSGNLQINNKTNFTLIGYGSTLTLTGTASAGNNIGIQLLGTCTNVTIEGLRIVGDNVITDAHAGVWGLSGATLTNITVKNNHIDNVTVGISLNANLSGSITGGLIEGNHLNNIIGTDPGTGYGIHHANGSGNPSNVRIVNNVIIGSQRHAIYQAKGSGVVIANNIVRNHRLTVYDGTMRSAISVGRSNDVIITKNIVDTFADGAIEVFTEGAAVGYDLQFDGNIITNNQNTFPAVIVGTASAAEGPTDIIFRNNFIHHSGLAIAAMRVYECLRCIFESNTMYVLASTDNTNVLEFYGTGETALTATYTDNISVRNNTLYGTAASGTMSGIRMEDNVVASSSRFKISGNSTYVPNDSISMPTGITNPNITIADNPINGLDFSGATVLSPSRMGAISVGLNGSAVNELRWGATDNCSDNTTVTHGADATPTAVLATGTVGGEIVSVTAIGATTFTVRILKHDGTAGTSQTIYWMALK